MSSNAQRFRHKPTRKEKQKVPQQAPRKEKYIEERKQKLKPIQPKTYNQSRYIKALQSEVLIVATGRAGSGKTYIAACHAANKLLAGEVKRVIIARPYVAMGKTTGFWPGSPTQKLLPYCRPILEAMKEQMGSAAFECNFDDSGESNISLQPLEAIRGMSFSDCILIIDEGQNATPEEIKSIVTRIGENCQLIFCGDPKQHDLRGVSGIDYLCGVIEKYNISNTAIIEFTVDDIVRSGICKEFISAFEREYE